MMKFFLYILLISQFLYSSNIILTQKEKEYIKINPVITLGGAKSFQPYLIQNNDGTISGYDVDIANLISQKTGLKIKFELGNWSTIQEKAKQRLYDGLSTSSDTQKRREYYNASLSYGNYTPLVIVNKGNPKKINTKSDIEGKKVAIQKNNQVFTNLAKTIKDVEIIYYDSMTDLIKALISKDVDYIIFDETVFYLARLLGVESLIESSFTIGKTVDVVFSLRNDAPELVSIMNKGINAINAKDYSKAKKEWFSVDIKEQKNELFTKEEINYLKNKKIIKICTDPNWLPFSSLKDNQYSGINSDIYKHIAQKIPIPLNLVRTQNWAESLEFGKNRKCDIFDIAIKTPDRKKYLNFTSPFLNIPLVIVTRLDTTFIYNYDTLKGKKVAITKGYAFIELLKNKYPFLDIVEVNNINEGLELVKTKKIFGYVGALPTIAHVLKQNYTDELKVAGRFDEKYSMGSAVRNDDEVLLNILQKAINSIPQEEIQTIINKWISIKYEEKIDYNLVLQVLSIGLVLVLFFIYKNYELNKRIKEELEKSRKKDNLIFQQNKMVSLGEMIGNIAHQWRQPLAQVSMIQNYILENLKDKKDIDPDIIDELRNSQAILQMMSHTIDTFQNIYNKNDQKKDKFNLSKEIEKVLIAVEQSIYLDSIEIKKDIDKSLVFKGVPNIFLQIVLSIVQNSLYFLKERDIKNPYIKIVLKQKQNGIVLNIEDNAKGIDEDILPQIFEYGFSKRDERISSTGVGLYITKIMVVDEMKGSIKAINTNYGVKFIIFLPKYTNVLI